ncbi:hypothetical protein CXF83_21810 [Shewanella sp. Choline-02u-19]|uniref:hypothetical protein n=1 Tax=unclassified Shewanella TaxID=196818 RepID=UPI000C34AF79|nr:MULTISPECIES: hypothetical protein [unclassified Shewanella]PKH59335.1 hypothetical protein CXF84_03550 [Shewanella sp. Bg11-22]PKI29154.1 hypothetical protein CXF83_21810 [Shewanella sp. Choline-02u-19]
MTFHLNRAADSTWLELYSNENVVMREELSNDIEQQKRDMINRLKFIVNEEQRRCKYKLVDKATLENNLKRFFA